MILSACHEEQTIPVEIDVILHVREDNHTSPLLVSIENKTKNASDFQWMFEGGEPSVSNKKNPEQVRFSEPGIHRIILEAWNDGDRRSEIFEIRVDSTVIVDFRTEAIINNYAPAVFKISNLSSGGNSYHWTFEGGSPATSEGQNPSEITYNQPGKYTIVLTVNNGSATFSTRKEVEVGLSLDASFEIIPSFEDEDYEAPLRATFDTHLQGVENLKWDCAEAVITNPESENAGIYFSASGTYTVYLTVSNGKETKQITRQITVKPNTNLRTHKNIHLGISSAQESIGAFYSTKLRRLFKTSDINIDNGFLIDIVYFGMNTNFTYNRFVSPDQLSSTSFKDIPGAKPTEFVHHSGLLTPAQFNSMTTDVLLKQFSINSPVNPELDYFTQPDIPCIVLFETFDGRKGAILVKEIKIDGNQNSYITVDIKVQKND